MRKSLLLILIFSLTAITCICAQERLPVLRVSFPGSFLENADYKQGNMILEDTDGSKVEFPAKMKTRGATALAYSMKPSFNMKLEEEDGTEIDYALLGMRKCSSYILDAMAIDRICMRNRVAFDIWNEYSRLPYSTDFDSRNGTVGKFVIVYMNDEYKGIYCLSDKVNRKLLDLKKPQVDGVESVIRGVLYKQGTTDIGNQETPGFFNDSTVYVAEWHDAWELKEPEDYPGIKAWAPLVEYYNFKNDFVFLNENFHIDNLVDYTLFVTALCLSDNWGNKNKYFSIKNTKSDDADNNRFIVTPWDLDTAFGGHYNGDYYDGNYSTWTVSQIFSSVKSPFSLAVSTSEGKELLRQRWVELRDGALSLESVASRLYAYCNLFVDSGAWKEYTDYWNARKDRPKFVENLRAEIDLIVDWYAKRLKSIDEYFGISDAAVSAPYDDADEGSIIYNLMGLPVDKSRLVPGSLYIRNGKKWIAP